MLKRKYYWTGTPEDQKLIAYMGSIDGYLGAAGLAAGDFDTPELLFHIVEIVYGVRVDAKIDLASNLRGIQAAIAGMPRKKRKECQKQSKLSARLRPRLTPKDAVLSPPPLNLAEASNYRPTAAEKSAFYAGWPWRTLRMEVLREQGRVCSCCGAMPGDVDQAGNIVKIVVDHIRPLSKYWHLRLEKVNLAVLCDSCNMGKGNWDETDWRRVA